MKPLYTCTKKKHLGINFVYTKLTTKACDLWVKPGRVVDFPVKIQNLKELYQLLEQGIAMGAIYISLKQHTKCWCCSSCKCLQAHHHSTEDHHWRTPVIQHWQIDASSELLPIHGIIGQADLCICSSPKWNHIVRLFSEALQRCRRSLWCWVFFCLFFCLSFFLIVIYRVQSKKKLIYWFSKYQRMD